MQIRKKGDEIKKKSSPLKLLSQSQPSFVEMILGWSSFIIVYISAVLYPRWLPLLKIETTKVWLQLAQWFVRRRFVCEFLIGSYVKLSSVVGAILIERPHRRTHFWKRTIQYPWVVLFHNCVHQRRPVSKMAAITKNRNFFKWPKLLYCKPESAQIWAILVESRDHRTQILEGDQPRIIPQKFGCNWPSGL
jgi:hypothetical protein